MLQSFKFISILSIAILVVGCRTQWSYLQILAFDQYAQDELIVLTQETLRETTMLSPALSEGKLPIAPIGVEKVMRFHIGTWEYHWILDLPVRLNNRKILTIAYDELLHRLYYVARYYYPQRAQTELRCIDIATGLESVVSSEKKGIGPVINAEIADMQIDDSTQKMYLLDHSMTQDQRILQIDKINGNRTTLILNTDKFTLDSSNQRLYYAHPDGVAHFDLSLDQHNVQVFSNLTPTKNSRWHLDSLNQRLIQMGVNKIHALDLQTQQESELFVAQDTTTSISFEYYLSQSNTIIGVQKVSLDPAWRIFNGYFVSVKPFSTATQSLELQRMKDDQKYMGEVRYTERQQPATWLTSTLTLIVCMIPDACVDISPINPY